MQGKTTVLEREGTLNNSVIFCDISLNKWRHTNMHKHMGVHIYTHTHTYRKDVLDGVYINWPVSASSMACFLSSFS